MILAVAIIRVIIKDPKWGENGEKFFIFSDYL